MKVWFLKLWLKLRVEWSNWRFRKDIGDIVDYPVEETGISTSKDIRALAKSLLESYEYTSDGPSQLFDAMRSPASCYREYKQGKLKDDCDGFHSALYHILDHNAWSCCLITYVAEPLRLSHTVLAVSFKRGWMILDYDWRTICSQNLARLVEDVAKSNSAQLIAWNAVRYDYNKGCWWIDKEINE